MTKSQAIHAPKRRGEWAELQFMARATGKGFTVSKPWGDSARYDFAVEYGGRFHRVQVKSTSYQNGSAYMCNTTSRGPTGKTYRYLRNQIDFFALFVVPEDLWYIIPRAALDRVRFAACINPRDPKSRYFRYLEAWDLLRK